jgi:hypothetical protein
MIDRVVTAVHCRSCCFSIQEFSRIRRVSLSLSLRAASSHDFLMERASRVHNRQVALATFALSRQEEGTPGGSFLEPGYGYLIHLPASLPTGQTSLNIRYTDYLTRLGYIESQRP